MNKIKRKIIVLLVLCLFTSGVFGQTVADRQADIPGTIWIKMNYDQKVMFIAGYFAGIREGFLQTHNKKLLDAMIATDLNDFIDLVNAYYIKYPKDINKSLSMALFWLSTYYRKFKAESIPTIPTD